LMAPCVMAWPRPGWPAERGRLQCVGSWGWGLLGPPALISVTTVIRAQGGRSAPQKSQWVTQTHCSPLCCSLRCVHPARPCDQSTARRLWPQQSPATPLRRGCGAIASCRACPAQFVGTAPLTLTTQGRQGAARTPCSGCVGCLAPVSRCDPVTSPCRSHHQSKLIIGYTRRVRLRIVSARLGGQCAAPRAVRCGAVRAAMFGGPGGLHAPPPRRRARAGQQRMMDACWERMFSLPGRN
jgi:hypothetical protein